ncbi:class I SAM-dependent methyltransferase [Brevundimonas goettingensis]|uniref:Class I SAM-dependent methyltransferase n=1 Tax=Brevundimonas goettingensis TaxID=2774190 RepID=A0A975BZR3_9CAUL|nr:class I SAM-dependent methyltransferase [Brevundimonas goettingensis]QTC90961.1 class I SAM-dependent methyltransferase [Brevundimonas goettingensis]
MTHPSASRIVGLYSDKAEGWIADRGPRLVAGEPRGLSEIDWFERFMTALPPGGTVLDVGSGSGWPVAAALIERGFRVTGVEPSPGLRAHAAETLPAGEWLDGDMRTLDLGDRRFDGLLAWHSLFHLSPADQRIALPRILSHAADACVFMTSTGQKEGEVIGEWRGEPLYHGSLAAEEYRTIFAAHGFTPNPIDPAEQDEYGNRWVARRG